MTLINDNSSVLSIGDTMPHFSLNATDGMLIDTRRIKDPVIVIIFTCNHCPYAEAYEDRIIKLAREFDEEGAQFILINSNDAERYPEDSFEQMKVRYEEKGFPCPYCFDESQEVAHKYGALCTPHCFVFDRERTLQYKGRIDDNWEHPDGVDEQNLHDAVAAIVHGKEPSIKEANAIGCSIKWKE